ncbi:Lipopolysaccharide export system permease protein LptF [Olavius algarvensis associated proteobacterium Delta 3]|nr:Lipopolysaccharide export system permease protein LptF [Olavius algarvensis associated proteobacterium Delta 3]CAB5084938.1 Lipopolysaccharide export system permease protein LptF [Olavius algarvensis associated proteobacterium Delta 3]
MPIFYRYMVREMLKFFTIVLILVLVLFVAVDYLGTMDEFIESGIALLRALFFVFLKIPFMIVMFIPVGVLLSVLITLGLMGKNNELVALKSSGVSVYYLFKPVLGFGICATALVLLLSEGIAPVTMAKANHIQSREIRRSVLVTAKEKNIWLKSHRQIIHIKFYNPAELMIHGLSLNVFDDDFRLVRRLDAGEGVFRGDQWDLKNVLELDLDRETGRYRVSYSERLSQVLSIQPEDLKKVVKKSEEMSFRELLGFIRRIESEGYDASAYRVDLHAKIAFPFVCIVMSLLGIAIGASGRLGKGLAGGIASGIGVAFIFWIFYSFCLSLGYGEVLPPWVAAWTANIIFLCAGWLLLQAAE